MLLLLVNTSVRVHDIVMACLRQIVHIILSNFTVETYCYSCNNSKETIYCMV